MGDHRFHVGQLVHYAQRGTGRSRVLGDFRVERLLPALDGAWQYRIKSVANGQERVAGEIELNDQGTIEALAQILYEADNGTGVPWAQRDRTIRNAWLAAARRRAVGDLMPP